jgi:DNA-directed RNA polymerase subunit RPC12/RpoP
MILKKQKIYKCMKCGSIVKADTKQKDRRRVRLRGQKFVIDV